MTDPYKGKRRITARIPRAALPPTEGSVPDLATWDPEAETEERCPACAACSMCAGKGMVSQTTARAYREQMKEQEDEGDA